MNKKSSIEVLKEIMQHYPNMKEFGRAIGEDSSDIIRWKTGKNRIKARAVVSICRLHPEVRPCELNKYIFPADVRLVFGDAE